MPGSSLIAGNINYRSTYNVLGLKFVYCNKWLMWIIWLLKEIISDLKLERGIKSKGLTQKSKK